MIGVSTSVVASTRSQIGRSPQPGTGVDEVGEQQVHREEAEPDRHGLLPARRCGRQVGVAGSGCRGIRHRHRPGGRLVEPALDAGASAAALGAHEPLAHREPPAALGRPLPGLEGLLVREAVEHVPHLRRLPRAHPPRAEEARVLVREVHAGLHPRGRLRDVRGVDLAPDRHGDRISRHAPIPPHRGFRAVTDAAGARRAAGAVRASSATHAIPAMPTTPTARTARGDPEAADQRHQEQRERDGRRHRAEAEHEQHRDAGDAADRVDRGRADGCRGRRAPTRSTRRRGRSKRANASTTGTTAAAATPSQSGRVAHHSSGQRLGQRHPDQPRSPRGSGRRAR